jgi:hypothetical protein
MYKSKYPKRPAKEIFRMLKSLMLSLKPIKPRAKKSAQIADLF